MGISKLLTMSDTKLDFSTSRTVIRDSWKNTVRQFRLTITRARIESSPAEKVLLYFAVGASLFISLFPFYLMTVASFAPRRFLYKTPPEIIPKELTLESIRVILIAESFPFIRYLFNSAFIGVTAATLAVTISILGAYSFARLEYRGRGIFARGVLVAYMFAGIVFVVPLFQMIVWAGWVDSYVGVIGVHFVFMIPLGLYLLGNFFRSIPREIEEAAMIDGYSRFEVLLYIIIPMSMPAIVAVFLYTFLLSWNEYLYASIFIRSSELFTLPLGIERLPQSFDQAWGQVMAASLLTTLPVFIMFIYLEKYMLTGLKFGSMD